MTPGDVVAERFRIESFAGEGGFGVVWRARDCITGDFVALKVARGQLTPAEVARLEREAQVLEGLSHPAIVRHVAHGLTDEGAHYLAMAWLDGEVLTDRLARGPLGIPATWRLLRVVSHALATVHALGVVHRDLKPSNLFLPDGDPARTTVLDFGIARWDERMYAMTRTGVILGTPGYMSPEQARGSREIDARTDVFALGCVAFECVAGRPPFVGGPPAAVMIRVATEDAPRVETVASDVPRDLADLVGQMLVRDPARRFADGGAVYGALEALGVA